MGHRIYLDNQGTQTTIMTSCSLPGQQQQASSYLSTGVWTTIPEAYQTPTGVVLKVSTAQGEQFIHVQGSAVSSMAQSPSLGTAQQMQVQSTASIPSSAMPPMQSMPTTQTQATQPMPPMQPMQPMNMGDMQMTMNPMGMRMGNMEMQMGSPAVDPAQPSQGKRFCSQCGSGIEASDRFCASCGHALT